MLYQEAVKPGTLELLRQLQEQGPLESFLLVGGTALALQLGHRMSDDLDLFSCKGFDPESIIPELESQFGFRTLHIAKNTLRGAIGDIRVDIMTHDYPWISPAIQEERIRMAHLSDIAAMKLNAIAGDGTRVKDFIDIYFILKRYTFRELLEWYETKYSNRSPVHVIKSLVWFDDIDPAAWPVMLREKELDLQKLTGFLTRQAEDFLNGLTA